MLKSIIGGCLLALGLSTQASAIRYDVTVLYGAANYAAATGINDEGQVIGITGVNTGLSPYIPYAVTWKNNENATFLGPAYSTANAINNAGQIAGQIFTAPSTSAVIWNGTTQTTLGGGGANAINNAGQAAGNGNGNNAVIWNGTTSTTLDSLRAAAAGDPRASVFGINDAGQAVGRTAVGAIGIDKPVIWNGTTGTLLAGLNSTTGGVANGINNAGQIIGYSTGQALMWDAANLATAPIVLGAFNPKAINDLGQVVGGRGILDLDHGGIRPGTARGVIWDGTTVIDINTLLTSDPFGIIITVLAGINSNGWMVGSGLDSDGNVRAVLLTPEGTFVAPVPLPGALPLFASGLGALGLFGWRRNRKAFAVSFGLRPLRRPGWRDGAPGAVPIRM